MTTGTTKPTIGFIGLGDMGEPMARRLLQAGFPVVSSANRSRTAIEALAAEGLTEVADPAAVGAVADFFITIVMDEAQTDTVLRGPTGALATLRPGVVVVVMSTLSPHYCQALAAELAPREIAVVDCPVSGLRARATEGTLSLMAGGDAAIIDRCRLVLDELGTTFVCGNVGMGMVAKLANNGIGMGTGALLVEIREMARAYGMNLDLLMEILKQSTANSFLLQAWPQVAPHIHRFASIGCKDVGLCLAAAAAVGTPTPMLSGWNDVDWDSKDPKTV